MVGLSAGAGTAPPPAAVGGLDSVMMLANGCLEECTAQCYKAALTELVEDGNESVSHVIVLNSGDHPVGLVNPPLPPEGCLVVPGSFNPLHVGHEEMARQAATVTGRPIETALFELCVWNPDKGSLPAEELIRRVEAVVTRGHRVLATRCPFFHQKAMLCKGCDFAIGYDTYRRIVDPKYYVPPGRTMEGATVEERREWVLAVLKSLQGNSIRMAVAGRLDGDSFKTLLEHSIFELPEEMQGLFLHVPEFRVDLSSTEIRNGLKKPDR